MHTGFATSEGTSRLAGRFRNGQDFYRPAQGLTLSSLGIGSYLGAMDEATDEGYAHALAAAVEGGINVIDTS